MTTRTRVVTGNDPLDGKINEYLGWYKDLKPEDEIHEIIKSKDVTKLSELFLKRLEFGTAGLRGRMGPGYSRMNDLVIIQTGQGLLQYLINSVEGFKEKGVVIGYDGRYNSSRFAELTATIFINSGIKVYMYSKVCPTPFVPFAVMKYKCAAGIMITASHNPKEDNGYKVYWENSAQIIPPHDKGIQKAILDNLEPSLTSWDVSVLNAAGNLCKDPLAEVLEDYCRIIKRNTVYPEINKSTILKFTYTAMHGVGFEYMKEAFRFANFKPFVIVEEQRDPDPEFPTVKFPNPEEGKSALDLSIKTADTNNSSIVLANDPDADRLGCAIKNKDGEWRILNGNEMGALLAWWMLHVHRVINPDADPADAYMLASTVSSKILASMAKKEGFQFEETLTGFKWMGNRCVKLLEEKKYILFAYEEAIGFMCGPSVLDKDGISAGIRLAEMAAYLETMGLTLLDKLEDIYKVYGHHISENSYWICHNQETIKKIFERLRNFAGQPNTYPMSIAGGKYSIIAVRDLTTGYDSTKPDKKAVLPISKSSQMITFTFDNGLVSTLRTSGTEPKIKYYTELCASPEQQNIDILKSNLAEMVSAIVSEFLLPEENSLIPRSS
ncbi:phosphoglucomutase-2 [Fopius arisanus]|uniref:PGM2 protein n=1 Tax=Fopius arisanus TaxID=64838 RepID=A0A0C9RME0_9HYME|nr:PREDICTED: phosphoglucomutase-2 [Fopius arisanus]XP_011310788.1 PREDICTED: phosphoglucomutase-2 [Fopius arisanus]XP_011310789.1 PREDICTED: phosphoglucomutase-2 [Fopius arisanus]